MSGRVYLVGAGPGDPGLLTLKGQRCLAAADCVIYDYLADPALLAFAPPEAERILVGKHGGGSKTPQEEINRLMIDRARAGRTVVRLKGGDPFIFGRGGEEAEELAAAGIPFEVVPGVSAGTAVPAYAGIPLTHRDFASSAALVTGQENPDKEGTSLDWDALSRFPGTLVFYMGVTTARHWSEELIRRGKSPQTPAASSRKIHGRPCAARPIIKPSAPVSRRTSSDFSVLSISPLAITGIRTLALMRAMVSYSAAPR